MCSLPLKNSPPRMSARIAGGATVEKTLVVKAATYHELHITTGEYGVVATIVFDI